MEQWITIMYCPKCNSAQIVSTKLNLNEKVELHIHVGDCKQCSKRGMF